MSLIISTLLRLRSVITRTSPCEVATNLTPAASASGSDRTVTAMLLPAARLFSIKKTNTYKPQKSRGGPPKSSHPSQGSARGGNRKTPSTAAPKSVVRPPYNDQLLPLFSEVRVISETGENLGLMATQDAILAAKSRNLDLILVSNQTTPAPAVCRIASYGDTLSALQGKELAARKTKRAPGEKSKEIRLTARTDEHDLGVKSSRVIEFLRSGLSVNVSVAFSMATAWGREEPARREVMAKLVRRVAEAGAGFAHQSTISGAGPALIALFTPTSSPKPMSDWDKTLAKLSVPIRPPDAAQIRGGRVLEPDHIESSAASALDGQATPLTLQLLPPVDLLRKFAARKVKVTTGKEEFDDRPGGKKTALPIEKLEKLSSGVDIDDGEGIVDAPLGGGRQRRGRPRVRQE